MLKPPCSPLTQRIPYSVFLFTYEAHSRLEKLGKAAPHRQTRTSLRGRTATVAILQKVTTFRPVTDGDCFDDSRIAKTERANLQNRGL